MLPGPLVSIYQQYKQDTNAVASWLASTARECGYPADLLSSGSWDVPAPSRPPKGGRPKGKNRKLLLAARSNNAGENTSPSNKYILALADFVPLAKFIAAKLSSPASVPDTFASTINRLIAVRSSFASRLAEHGVKPDAQADSQHGHLVGILEEVRDALRPRMSTKAAATQTATIPRTGAAASADGLASRFTVLEVSEPSEALRNATAAERPQPAAGDKTVFEAEPQTSLDDALFAISAMVQDLLGIRSAIKSIWSNYGNGVFDLAAAAVATNAVTELARGVIDDVAPVFERYGGYLKLSSQFFAAICMSRGISLDQVDKFMTTENSYTDEAYTIANDLSITTHRALRGFLDVLDPRDVPIMKEGFFGKYDPASYRSPKTGQQMADDDKILLMEFFSEIMTAIRLVPDYPVQDDFLRGMKEMDKTHQVPLSLVFAAQVFLDIHHTLREKTATGASRLLAETAVMERELQRYFDFHRNLKIDQWPEFNEQEVRRLHGEMGWISRDPVHKAKVRAMRRLMEVPDSYRPHRILQSSPVLAGLLLFRFRYRMHQANIAVADTWGSIQYTTHLYHALREEKLLRGPWLDLDMARTLLRDASFFVGDPPATPTDYLKKFCLQMGMTMSAFAKPALRRSSAALASRAGPRGIQAGLPVSSMFAKRLLGGTGQMDWTAEHIDEILARSEFAVEGSEEDGTLIMTLMDDEQVKEQKQRKKPQKKPQQKPQARNNTTATATNNNSSKGKAKATTTQPAPSPATLATSIAMALHAETLPLSFPYLALHRSCWQRLRDVRAACDALLRTAYAPNYLERENQLPFVVGYIFMAAHDGDLELLRAAADAVNGLMESGEGELAVAVGVLREMGHHVAFGVEVEEGGGDGDGEE